MRLSCPSKTVQVCKAVGSTLQINHAHRHEQREPRDCQVELDPARLLLQPFTGGEKEQTMLYYSLVFLIVGLVAAALGISGVAAVASQIAWVLFLIGVVLLVVHLISGRRTVV